MPTTVGFGAHGSYAGLQKIAVWTDEGPERKRREKVLNWFNRTLEKNKAEKTRFNKQVDRLLHQSRTAKDAEEAQRRLDELEVALFCLPDGSRKQDARLYHDTQQAYSKVEAREERRRLRLEIDYLRDFLKPGYEVKFKTASCYEEPRKRLYAREIARRQRSEDRESRSMTVKWHSEEEKMADDMDQSLQRDAVGAVAEHRANVADQRAARSAMTAAANLAARRKDAVDERGEDWNYDVPAPVRKHSCKANQESFDWIKDRRPTDEGFVLLSRGNRSNPPQLRQLGPRRRGPVPPRREAPTHLGLARLPFNAHFGDDDVGKPPHKVPEQDCTVETKFRRKPATWFYD